VVQGESAVMKFEDDRVERWTRDGERLVAEHWFPSSQFPAATPVVGIAQRTP
jgi:predicted acyl esterase